MKRINTSRKVVVGITDRRVKLINDVLQGMKVIKFYGWEGSFLQVHYITLGNSAIILPTLAIL
jgi:hypothetical protein